MKDVPQKARAVIIGGGVIGCSVAYHLAKIGWTDIVLLERKQFTCGTTWHAAGLIAQLRQTQNMTKLAKYSQELYYGLEAETGIATGFKRVGSITVALTEERKEEIYRGASMARSFGVEIEEIGASDVRDKYPHLNVDDVVGAVYLPKDGQGDPANIALALAKGARQMGAKTIEGVKVTKIHKAGGRVTGVSWKSDSSGEGRIEADVVINCAGMWGREVGRMAGVNVPLHACEHFYIVTEAINGLTQLPVLRVPDECVYYKEDAGKMLVGAFEPVSKPWGMDGIAEDFCFDQLPEDFDHFEPILEQAVNRIPMLGEAGIHTFFNGPESFTPDDRYLLGEAPELRNFYVAAGFNSVGIQSAGGAGKALAEWIDAGEPPFDLWDVDIRRMAPFQGNSRYLRERVTETLGLLYADHFPYRQFASARNVRHTPLHERLEANGACFGELSGWERANWFVPQADRDKGVKPEYAYTWKRQNWFDYSADEHRAVRETVGMFDMSTFGKFRVEGRDACDVLQRISGNNVDVEAGKLVYTQWLNRNGGIEADLTVSRISETEFMVITAAGTTARDFSWLKQSICDDAHCVATDVTAGESVLAVMGPNSRALLQTLTPADLSTEAFPFGTFKTIEFGLTQVRAHRITYVGELGWEIYVSSDMARHVFDTIMAAGESHGLRLAGMHALDSCRIEKAFRHYGHDISTEDHVLEAGLGFAVKTDKPTGKFGDFIGREAVLRKKQAGLSKRMVQFQLSDPEPLLFHTEPVFRNGELVGYLTSGNYGHHLGAAIGLGYVETEIGEKPADILASAYEIEVAGVRVKAQASMKPLYDPKSERIRA